MISSRVVGTTGPSFFMSGMQRKEHSVPVHEAVGVLEMVVECVDHRLARADIGLYDHNVVRKKVGLFPWTCGRRGLWTLRRETPRASLPYALKRRSAPAIGKKPMKVLVLGAFRVDSRCRDQLQRAVSAGDDKVTAAIEIGGSEYATVGAVVRHDED